MIIQHNISAMNSHRVMGVNNKATAKNLEKLSSGYRINRAGDDAAGLAISEKMRGQIRGLAMAENNASNGISLIQTAEGGLNETHAILQRMRELAVQSANGTYDDDVDRANIAKEVEALKGEIDRIAESTHYNGIKLLNGSMGGKASVAADLGTGGVADSVTLENTAFADPLDGKTGTLSRKTIDGKVFYSLQVGDQTYATKADALDLLDKDGNVVAKAVAGAKDGVITDLTVTKNAAVAITGDSVTAYDDAQLIFQIGANGTLDQRVGLHVGNMSTGALGSAEGVIDNISVASRELANDAIKVIDAATNMVSGTRADLGALQNRLEHTLNNLGVTKENLQAAESSIRDVDMAKEMMEFTKNNILVQASQAMLAQANQLPQGVLQLLQ